MIAEAFHIYSIPALIMLSAPAMLLHSETPVY